MPSAMSVNMLGWRVRMDAHPRSKNGQPAQNTTGVEQTRPIQLMIVIATASTVVEPEEDRRVPAAKHAEHVGHRQDEDRRADRRGDPEAPRHVDELGIRPIVGRDRHRLERHPAFRAGARARAGRSRDAWDTCRARRSTPPARLSARGFRKDSGSALNRVRHDGLQK